MEKLKFTRPAPVFDTDKNSKYRFSEALRNLTDEEDSRSVYRIFLDGKPAYVGEAHKQQLYKTITRHFQKHDDARQGRWVGREGMGTFTFDVSEQADNLDELMREEAKQVITLKPFGNLFFNTGNPRSKEDGKYSAVFDKLSAVAEFESGEPLNPKEDISPAQFETLYSRLEGFDAYERLLESENDRYKDADADAEAEREFERELYKEMQEIEQRDKNL